MQPVAFMVADEHGQMEIGEFIAGGAPSFCTGIIAPSECEAYAAAYAWREGEDEPLAKIRVIPVYA